MLGITKKMFSVVLSSIANASNHTKYQKMRDPTYSY